MTALTHRAIWDLGFQGDWVVGYEKGNIRINVIEDEDTTDRFFVSVGGVRMGRVRTVEELDRIWKTHQGIFR